MTALGEVRMRVLAGRYELFHLGRACGVEQWRIEPLGDGYVITGDQELVAPHPIPNRQEYRATVDRSGRLTGLEIRWNVGMRALHATHRANDDMWRVRIEYGGEVKEQEGDYPSGCEVEYGTRVVQKRDGGSVYPVYGGGGAPQSAQLSVMSRQVPPASLLA